MKKTFLSIIFSLTIINQYLFTLDYFYHYEGPSEHHSAELPWINAGCHLVRVHENKNGEPDYEELEFKMAAWKNKG